MASVSRILHITSHRSITSLRSLCSEKILSNISLPVLHQGSNSRHQRSQFQFYSSDTESKGRILTESTLIVQDGIDIEELPILIKRATRNSYPFSSHTYTGSKFEEETEFDNTFRQLLHNCYSVNDVFKLLEVPSEKVRGLSASLALQRLHVLKYLNTDWNQIHSFIRSAVMRELYDTVQRDVVLLSSSTLISLVECYLAADGFSPQCLDAINNEIQSRIGDGVFSIEELLTLVNILKTSNKTEVSQVPFFVSPKVPSVSIVSENASRFLSNDDDGQIKMEQFDKFSAKASPQSREEIRQKSSELLNLVWIHLSSRYPDFDEHTLPLILKTLTASNRSIIKLLEKPFSRCWSSLSAEAVGTALDSLVRLHANNTAIFTNLGRWAYVHIHQMTPSLLLKFLNTFIQCGFLDENLMKVMERCLSLKSQLVQTDVIAMCVEYCRSCSYLSPLIMDAAASHFTQYAYSYEPLQLYVVLRAYGQLNYLPSQSAPFLKKVESCIWDRLDHLSEAQLLEILGSFTFVDVMPSNFYSLICSEQFHAKLKKVTNHSSVVSSLIWLRVIKHAVALSRSNDLDANLQWVLSKRNRRFVHFYRDKQAAGVACIKSVLTELIGFNYFHVLPFYDCCAIYINSDGLPLEVREAKLDFAEIQQVDKKVVILIRSADHFIVNTNQLIGVQAQRVKQLKELGFIPIEVRMSHILYREGLGQGGDPLMKMHLAPYINFNKFEKISAQKQVSASKDMKNSLSDWLGYEKEDDDDDDDFSFDSKDGIIVPVLWNEKRIKTVSVEESGLLNRQPPEVDKDNS